MNSSESLKMVDDAFEAYWKTVPIFPVPEDHELHKIVSHTAFVAGFSLGVEHALRKIAKL